MNKRLILAFFFILITLCLIDAQEKKIELDIVRDSIILTSGVALWTAAELLDQEVAPDYTIYPTAQINPFDRSVMFPYSANLDLLGDGLQYSTMILPGVLGLFSPTDQWLTIGTVYLESVLWAYGMKNLLKAVIPRNRPFMSFNNPPADYLANGDFQKSFPSGHTTMACNSAAFLTFMLYYYNPHSPWNLPVALTSYAFAFSTGMMRILSGNHFISDVLAGALLGTTTGILVPLLHLKEAKSQGATLALSFNLIEFTIHY